jgi:ribose transport system ATP-binding protein
MEPLVSMRGVTKFIYGSDGRPLRNTEVKILDGVDFEVFPGEVHVLVGENGAGKSTLMKILGGIIPPDAGELRIAGKKATPANAQDARKKGVAFIHQELNLCANLDVAHNIFLGREPRRRGLKDAGEMVRRSAELLKALAADLDPRLSVSRLSTAQQQLVEIAKAMSFKSRVVIMDEPTASLTKREIDTLFDLIRRMRADGMGIIYISHRFEEILAIGDRFTVLRDGRRVSNLPIQEFKPEFGDLDDGRAIHRRDVPARARGASGAGAGGARPPPRPAHPAHRPGRAAGRGGGPRRPRGEWPH